MKNLKSKKVTVLSVSNANLQKILQSSQVLVLCINTGADKQTSVVELEQPEKKRKEKLGTDEYGFRKGSAVSKVFDMLVKGTTMDKIRSVAGNNTPFLLHTLKAKVNSKFSDGRPVYSARSAVIKKDNNGNMQLIKYTDKQGKVHKIHSKKAA